MMSVKVSRIFHAGYCFEFNKTRILFDPIFENPFSHNCHAYPSVQFDVGAIKKLKPSAVFISHYHDDHCSLESLNHLDRSTPIYLYCIFEELFQMIRDLGFRDVNSLDLNIAVNIHEFQITPRAAQNQDVDSMFHIQVDGLHILNVVDSKIDSDTLLKLSKHSPWDLVLWPFQEMKELDVLAPRTRAPADRQLSTEILDQIQILNPKTIIPSSCQFIFEDWSWMNHLYFPISYQQFERDVRARLPDTKVVNLNPSCSLSLSHGTFNPSEPLSWVHPQGPQELDYSYNFNVQIPSIAEIAKKLKTISLSEFSEVVEFCKVGIVNIISGLDLLQDSFFSKSRIWKLSVYDSLGARTDFFYQILDQQIHLLEDAQEHFDWLTEIPAAKVFSAMKFGESLSSIYIRINDFDMPPRNGPEFDPLEDPLLRCLYGQEFAAYQKSQLRKILFKS